MARRPRTQLSPAKDPLGHPRSLENRLRLRLPRAEPNARGQDTYQSQPTGQVEGRPTPCTVLPAGHPDAADVQAAAAEEVVDATYVAALQNALPREQQRIELIIRAARAESQHHVRSHGFHHVHGPGELVVLLVPRARQCSCQRYQ